MLRIELAYLVKGRRILLPGKCRDLLNLILRRLLRNPLKIFARAIYCCNCSASTLLFNDQS